MSVIFVSYIFGHIKITIVVTTIMKTQNNAKSYNLTSNDNNGSDNNDDNPK